MRVLIYNQLSTNSKIQKIIRMLEADDFRSAEVKKIGANLYRAKVDHSGRLLFSLYHYNNATYCLLLEYLPNHEYEKSRFLAHGAQIDEAQIPDVTTIPAPEDTLHYVNSNNNRFNLLNKIISFDDEQNNIYQLQPPLIIIGSAGSGKTALSLEKMKEAKGDVLYVSRSSYLVQNSRDLYYAHDYQNEDQEIDFLSFHEFLEHIRVPPGKELTSKIFEGWFARYARQLGLKDAHKVFEEFRGVITGSLTKNTIDGMNASPWGEAYFSRTTYLSLGVKQSIFPEEERAKVYDLFEKYLQFLKENNYYDPNLISHAYLDFVSPSYDYVVIDEVQDLTTVQLFLILQTLRCPTNFLFCGDSNQIVHPNFFSWAKVKTLFHEHGQWQQNSELLRVLSSNYRNSPEVINIANKVLKIKQARFGSIDKESNFLVDSVGAHPGTIKNFAETAQTLQELNQKTAKSTRFAVLVMHPEQKIKAKEIFNTPLVFSVQEAKGLEYDNIILYNFVSDESKMFMDIIQGVEHIDFNAPLEYARNKDKTDKSAEVYKFFINALYVAITRAVKNLYLIEQKPRHPMLALLAINETTELKDLAQENSSHEEWQLEARKLELQGKTEQADEIRQRLLQQKQVPWTVYDKTTFQDLYQRSLATQDKKLKLLVTEHSVMYRNQHILDELSKFDFKPARNPENCYRQAIDNHLRHYTLRNPDAVIKETEKYGLDHRTLFNFTPLMTATLLGNSDLVKKLCEYGADKSLVQNTDLTAFQIALSKASEDKNYAQKILPQIFHLLQPSSISLQVDGQLVKIDNRIMEFMMFYAATLLFYRVLGEKLVMSDGLGSQDFVEFFSRIPDSILPERRKKRSYISSMLSKNERNKQDRYNRKLFLRLRVGHYVINPEIQIKQGENWIPIYQLLDLDCLYATPGEQIFKEGRYVDPRWLQSQIETTNQLNDKVLSEFKDSIKKKLITENNDLAKV